MWEGIFNRLKDGDGQAGVERERLGIWAFKARVLLPLVAHPLPSPPEVHSRPDLLLRALPYNDLCSMLMGMLNSQGGEKPGAPVGQGNFHSTLASLFGGDASGKSNKVWQRPLAESG